MITLMITQAFLLGSTQTFFTNNSIGSFKPDFHITTYTKDSSSDEGIETITRSTLRENEDYQTRYLQNLRQLLTGATSFHVEKSSWNYTAVLELGKLQLASISRRIVVSKQN